MSCHQFNSMPLQLGGVEIRRCNSPEPACSKSLLLNVIVSFRLVELSTCIQAYDKLEVNITYKTVEVIILTWGQTRRDLVHLQKKLRQLELEKKRKGKKIGPKIGVRKNKSLLYSWKSPRVERHFRA